jgi:spore coat protein CotH
LLGNPLKANCRAISSLLILVGLIACGFPRSDRADLPVVSLEVKGPIASETKTPVTLRITGASQASSNEFSGLIRIHGASSRMYPKKSFGITLDQPVRWFGMRESAHWVLNAAFVDRSLMRHKLSYDLFRSLSTTNAARLASGSRFVEVNLNGTYKGVFLLMERVDRTMLGLKRYDTNAAEHACIYKCIDHFTRMNALSHAAYEQREPDPTIQAYWGPLDRFNRFVNTSSDKEFFDPIKGIASQLDLDNTIDFHLLVLLTSNMDGHDKNFVLGRDAPQRGAPPPRFFYVPWDYDATFGRTWNGAPFRPSAWLTNPLWERLLTNADYRKKFGARWKQLRKREFSLPTIFRMIDENVRTLGAAAGRDHARWRGQSVEQDVAQMKEWLQQRVEWLDQEITRRTFQ